MEQQASKLQLDFKKFATALLLGGTSSQRSLMGGSTIANTLFHKAAL